MIWLQQLLKLISLSVLALAVCAGSAPAQYLELRSQLRDQLAEFRKSQSSSSWERWKSAVEYRKLERELFVQGGTVQPKTLENTRLKIVADKSLNPRTQAIAETLQALADAIKPLADEERPAYLDQVAKQLVPTNDSALTAARQRLLTELDSLNIQLRAGKDQGKAWRAFLLWPEVEQLLSEKAPDDKTLDQLEARWSTAPLAWETPLIHACGQEIETVCALLRRNEIMVKQVAAEMAAARSAPNNSGEPTKRPSPLKILSKLERIDCGSRLTHAARRKENATRPMLTVAMQPSYFGSNRDINENFAINDPRANGNGQIRGRQTMSLLENPNRLQMRAQFQGTNTSQTSSFTQGVSINSSATSDMRGSKDFFWGPAGMVAEPAQVTATTSLQFTGVGVGGGRRYQSEARSRVNASRGTAERDTQLAVERGLRERLDKEGTRTSADLNKNYKREFLDPLLRQQFFQPRLATSSSANQGRWQASLVHPHEMLALPAPPLLESTLLQATAHQLFPARMLAMRLTSPQLDQTNWRKVLGTQLAERLAPRAEEDDSEWSIVLQREQPCEFTFHAPNVVELKIHLLNFQNPEFEHDDLDLLLKFESSSSDGKWKLQRKLPPEVLFLADRATGEPAGQLSGRQLSLRSMLRRRLVQLVGEELILTPADLGFVSHSGGPLAFEKIVCGEEWLVMNMIRAN